MTLSTFIGILHSRLEDLGLEKAYIDHTCGKISFYLESLSEDEREKQICEEYLESIVDASRSEAERQKTEALELIRSVESILDTVDKNEEKVRNELIFLLVFAMIRLLMVCPLWVFPNWW